MANGGGELGGGRKVPWRAIGWGGAGLLLLVPMAAMQVTDEVAWNAFDFVFMGAMMGAVGLGLELAVRRSGLPAYRAGAAAALAAGFLLVWITGAVGVIGSEREVANLLYAAVPGTALLGAAAARGRPAGMARAMAAAALVQVLVPAAALALGWAPRALVLAPEVIGASCVFAALWLGSAGLFRAAAAREAAPR